MDRNAASAKLKHCPAAVVCLASFFQRRFHHSALHVERRVRHHEVGSPDRVLVVQQGYRRFAAELKSDTRIARIPPPASVVGLSWP